jgi:DNA-binding NarL/FixJ family response regulator
MLEFIHQAGEAAGPCLMNNILNRKMQRFAHLLCWAIALILFPIIFLGWVTESTSERIHRLRRQGLTHRAIAKQLGVSQSKVQRTLAKKRKK